MHTIAELTNPQALQALALPADIRLGQELFAKGDVKLVENLPSSVKAHIRGFPARKTRLLATDQAFSWGCTCTSQPDHFCKHLVATVLAVHAAAPPAAAGAQAAPPADA